MTTQVAFPNLVSRIFLKQAFEKQFIVPTDPPWLLERFLCFVEKVILRPKVDKITIDRPIFLMGIHRSGTTMLQDLLCSHPDVAYINNAMPSFRRCFCAAEYFRKKLRLDFRGERMLKDSVDVEAGSPNEGVAFWRDWFSEDHHSLAYTPLRNEACPRTVDAVHHGVKKILWCKGGSSDRFFCKNPQLIPHIEFIQELFPDARFIHLIRDARTCANSMVKLYRLEQKQLDFIRQSGGHHVFKDKPYIAFPRLPRLAEYVQQYGPDNIQTTARLWNDSMTYIRERKDGIPFFHEVRYEDILNEPRRQLSRLLEFCELPPIPDDHAPFWRKLEKVGQVRHSNQYDNFDLIEEICRKNLKLHGYL